MSIQSGPLGHDFSPVVEVLRRFEGERLVFSPNPGNAGDSAINFACYRLFEKLGLPYELYRREKDYRDRVVVFAGGGNLTSAASPVAVGIDRVRRDCRALVLLPHTVTCFDSLWSELDGRATLFAREQPSLDFLRRHATGGATVLPAHDMVFSLDLSELGRAHAMRSFLDCVRRGDERWKAMVRAVGNLAASGGALSAIRTDSEKTGVALPRHNVDISRRLWPVDHGRENAERITRLMFLYLSLPRRTVTNRLHVGIVSSLVGTPVTMLDNSYGKNGNVYRFSMRDLPSVEFRAENPRKMEGISAGAKA